MPWLPLFVTRNSRVGRNRNIHHERGSGFVKEAAYVS